jgi:hypothetical protein
MIDPKLKDISAIRLETVVRWRTESRENSKPLCDVLRSDGICSGGF